MNLQGRKLISKYGRRETTDRFLIFFAFAFFWACVFYVLRKRQDSDISLIDVTLIDL